MLFVIATIVCVFRKKSPSIRKSKDSRWASSGRAAAVAWAVGMLTFFGSLESLACAQDDSTRSVLAFDGSQPSYSAKVELESIPQSASSKPSFRPRPVDGGKYLPPAPPANMLTASPSKARFRVPGSGTLTAAPKPPQLKKTASDFLNTNSLRPGPDDGDDDFVAKSDVGNDSGTFAANRPVVIQQGFEAPSVKNSTDRFGKFGAGPDSSRSGSDRFAPRARLASNTTLPPPPRPQASQNLNPKPGSNKPIVASSPVTRPQAFDNADRVSPPKQPAIGAGFEKSKPSIDRPGDRFSSSLPSTNSAAELPKEQKLQPFVSPNVKQAGNGFPPVGAGSNQMTARTQPANKSPVSPTRFSAPLGNQPEPSVSKDNGMLPRNNTNMDRRNANLSGRPEVHQPNSFASNNSIRQPDSSSRASLRNNGIGQPRMGAGDTSFDSTSNSLREPRSLARGNTPARSSLGSPISNKPLKSFRVSEEPISTAAPAKERSVFQQTSTQLPTANQPQSNASRNAPSSKSVDRSEIEFARSQFTQMQVLAARGNGTPIRLVEMFMEPLSPMQRKQMVSQYWESYYDLASLKIATDYQQWLDSIKTSNQVDQTLLSAARQMADDRRLAAEIQLGKSQSRLLDFMPNPRGAQFLPVPADQPLIEQYVTDIEKYARLRNVPTNLRGIDPMLKRTLTLITHRAATVAAAQKAANQTLQAIPNRQATLASAIAAGQLWRDARMDMVASAVNYNQAISDFVLTLEPNRSPTQLSAFMLGTPKAAQPSANTRPKSVISPNPAFNGQPVRNAVNPAAWR